jgi:hypothetical protein
VDDAKQINATGSYEDWGFSVSPPALDPSPQQFVGRLHAHPADAIEINANRLIRILIDVAIQVLLANDGG